MEGLEMSSSPKPIVLEKEIVRFDIHQIIQHIVLMVSFTLLALTGLPMKFHDWAISQWWIGVWGGVDIVRSIHRVSAWAMVFDCVYHLLYLGYNILVLRKPFPRRMVPAVKDFKDFFQEMGYFVGLVKEQPKFDRFNWREKFDYWAIFWGMPVIGISGFIMMYPVFATKFLPGWAVPAAFVAHGDEAVLAVVWIAVVHVVFNHFAPRVFPFNSSIFTGKVARERYRHEHPLEYERLVGAEEIEDLPAEAVPVIPERPTKPAPAPIDVATPKRGGALRELFTDAATATGGALIVFSVGLLILILAAALPGGNPYIGIFLFVLLPVVALGGLLVFIFGAVMRGRSTDLPGAEEGESQERSIPEGESPEDSKREDS
jgi:cytochrome b subunit of formate dehydrogenase